MERIRSPNHVQVPPVGHPLRTLLAARPVGANSLPIHLATAAPVPHRRRSRPRSPRDHLSRNHTPVPPASRPIPRLVNRRRTVWFSGSLLGFVEACWDLWRRVGICGAAFTFREDHTDLWDTVEGRRCTAG